MKNKNIFIPKKLKVGFQNRKETYTGKLAYVIYYDVKGLLHKVSSWEGWRDKNIPSLEVDNTPQSGFCLNKDVKRFNWSHFGSNRSYIRVYDPRGIEFEVTPENLIGILTETDCLKRGLEGNFVYAYKGSELILLPCASEEYQKAVEHTERQNLSISAKDLKIGCSYTTKNGEEIVYVGRFPVKTIANRDAYLGTPLEFNKFSKKHIFCTKNDTKYTFLPKSDLKFLAYLNSETPVTDYPFIIDEMNCNNKFHSINGWDYEADDVTENDIFEKDVRTDYWNRLGKRNTFIKQYGNILKFFTFYKDCNNKYVMNYQRSIDTSKNVILPWESSSFLSNNDIIFPTRTDVLDFVKTCVRVKALLSSGKKQEIKFWDELI